MIDTGCASCQGVSISIDGIARGGVYDKPLRDMILAFKFNDRTELSGQLCFLLNSALQGSDFKNDIDMFVPVPLHWRRRLGRGFNQSLILCKGLDHRRRISTELVRIRHTQRQWNLDLGKRIKNVADAFAVRKGHDFSGKNICLVDDISTTRSTLEECAKTLKEAGAEKVFALVCAVAMQDTAR
jgi:ComF family protein